MKQMLIGSLACLAMASAIAATEPTEKDAIAMAERGAAFIKAHGKDALLAVNGFDPIYRKAGDDVDLCWRLMDCGWTIGFHAGAHLEAQVRKPRAERTAAELNHIPFDTLFREVGAALSDIPELAELT